MPIRPTRSLVCLSALLGLLVSLLGVAPALNAQSGGRAVRVQPGARPGEATFTIADSSVGVGAQYIVVRNFKISELTPTENDHEYALTILAVTPEGEPDQHVVGGILFDIDGQPVVVPFGQNGVGDVVVKTKPRAARITLRAVDSNVTRTVDLPSRRSWFLFGGGALVVLLVVLMRRKRQRRAQAS